MRTPDRNLILVATIGTRDLAYQDSSGNWLNVGNDRAKNWDSITQEAQVIMDLETDPAVTEAPGKTFRDRTKYLSNNFPKYRSRLKPIILGKLLKNYSLQLKRVYLIATDRPETVEERFRGKDTLYCAEIIRLWLAAEYRIATKVIPLVDDPSDFDAMIRWCKKKVWKYIESDPQLDKFSEISNILISPKGGVGQSSEVLGCG